MGIFKIKNQLLKVIEWKDDTKDTISYRFEVPDRYEIMNGSELIVRESQAAIFVYRGEFKDVFMPGSYKLSTQNLPMLTALFNWKYAFESKYQGEIYFFNLKDFTAQKWGTQNPIMMRDADFGVVRLRAYGQYSYKVKRPKVFINTLGGTKGTIKTGDINESLMRAIVSTLSEAIADSKCAALDLAANYEDIGNMATTRVAQYFDDHGLELTSFHIENISLPKEVEEAMDTRTKMGVLGDMGNYTRYQVAQSIPDAAKTPNSMAGMGMGLSAGIGMGGMMAGTMAGAIHDQGRQSAPAATATPEVKGVKCPSCGGSVPEGSKFCPKCGKPMQAVCPKCGASVAADSKFCPECGQPLGVTKCPECGAELPAGSKFCPKCGKKL